MLKHTYLIVHVSLRHITGMTQITPTKKTNQTKNYDDDGNDDDGYDDENDDKNHHYIIGNLVKDHNKTETIPKKEDFGQRLF